MGLWENFRNLINNSADDDFDDGLENEVEDNASDYPDFDSYEPIKKPEPRVFRNDKKVVSYAPSSQMQVVLVRPERIEDAPAIADHLNAKKTVVLNLEVADRENSRRIVDFLMGAAYANGGSMKKVANSTFIIVPKTVDLSGELMLDELESDASLYY